MTGEPDEPPEVLQDYLRDYSNTGVSFYLDQLRTQWQGELPE